MTTQCQCLVTAGLKAQVYYPTDAKYKAREASYWSADSPLSPLCIVQPRNTAEVSLALKTLANASGNFAVRSGGHMQWAGGSDIHNGVTIEYVFPQIYYTSMFISKVSTRETFL